MSSSKSQNPIDYVRLGEAIRNMRVLENASQVEFAKSAGVSDSTLMKLENGRKIQWRMIERICERKGIYLEGLLNTPVKPVLELPFAVHTASTASWQAHGDLRKVIPENNHQLVQNADERLRLLRLGLVEFFIASMEFIMPEGPASIYIELGLEVGPVNKTSYKDALMHCLSGQALFQAEDRSVILNPGDFVGYRNDLEIRITPTESLSPHFEPPKLLWVGGNRIGRIANRSRMKSSNR